MRLEKSFLFLYHIFEEKKRVNILFTHFILVFYMYMYIGHLETYKQCIILSLILTGGCYTVLH